jgi:hypothetical protein
MRQTVIDHPNEYKISLLINAMKEVFNSGKRNTAVFGVCNRGVRGQPNPDTMNNFWKNARCLE